MNQPLHHDTPNHGYSGVVKVDWRVEWRSVVLSVESRLSLYVSDGHKRVRRRPGERHLPECILPDIQATPQASWCGGHQLQLAAALGVSAGNRYIAQVVVPATAISSTGR